MGNQRRSMWQLTIMTTIAILVLAQGAVGQEPVKVNPPRYIAVVGFRNLRPGTDTDWVAGFAACGPPCAAASCGHRDTTIRSQERQSGEPESQGQATESQGGTRHAQTRAASRGLLLRIFLGHRVGTF